MFGRYISVVNESETKGVKGFLCLSYMDNVTCFDANNIAFQAFSLLADIIVTIATLLTRRDIKKGTADLCACVTAIFMAIFNEDFFSVFDGLDKNLVVTVHITS